MKIRSANSFVYKVHCLQAKLREQGFYQGELHGEFDDMTADAVKAFQSARGLIADGIAGIITLYALDLLDWGATE